MDKVVPDLYIWDGRMAELGSRLIAHLFHMLAEAVAVPCNGTVASKLFLSTTFLGAFFSYYYLLLPLALENTQRQFVRYSLELFVADQGLGHGHNRPDACGEIRTFERDGTSSGGHSRQPGYYSVPGALPKDGSRSIGCIEE
jgi:hypothetical protein